MTEDESGDLNVLGCRRPALTSLPLRFFFFNLFNSRFVICFSPVIQRVVRGRESKGVECSLLFPSERLNLKVVQKFESSTGTLEPQRTCWFGLLLGFRFRFRLQLPNSPTAMAATAAQPTAPRVLVCFTFLLLRLIIFLLGPQTAHAEYRIHAHVGRGTLFWVGDV